MRTVTKFQAEDGSLHDSEKACRDYELFMDIEKCLTDIVGKDKAAACASRLVCNYAILKKADGLV